METCRCNALARGNAAADGLPQSVHCASGAPFERVLLSISVPGMTSPSHNRLVLEAATSSPRPRARIAASVGRAGRCHDCSLQTDQPLLQRTKSNPFLVVTITCTYTLVTHFRTSGPSHMCIHSAVGAPIPRHSLFPRYSSRPPSRDDGVVGYLLRATTRKEEEETAAGHW